MSFVAFPRAAHQRLHDAGASYYVWEGTLEGGISYAITSNVSASINAAYTDSKNERGLIETDLGGLIGIYWRF